MSGSQRPYHNYPQYGSTDQRAPQPPPPPPPPHPPVQRAPVAYVTPVRQQAPFPPNINSPTPNGQAPAPPLRTPNAQYGTSSSHYFDPLERPVERPQPPAKITTPSSSWGYNSYHAQPPVPSPTASHHGNVYDVIRDRPIEPVTRPQAPQAPQAPSLPINAPRAPQAPKAPQAPVAAVAPVNPPTPRTPTELKQHNGAPWASKAQPASSQRRDGAMSISSLLSNPASDTREQTSPPPIETPTRSMAKVVETEARNGHIPHSHSGKTPGKQTASKAPAYNPPVSIPQAKHHRHTTEKEHSQPQSQSQSQSHSQSTQDSFKKSSSFKDFKYHDSMNIDHAESERVDDTDVDEEVYADALNRYKVNRQKRKLGLMTEEAEIRKNRVVILGLSFQTALKQASVVGRARANERFEPEAANIIKAKAEEEEKQRKKEQQKTRRREKAAMNNKVREEQRAKDKAEAALKKRKEDDERNAKLAEQRSRLDDESIHDTDNSAAVVLDEDGAKIKKRKVAPKKAKAKAPVPAKEEPVVPEKIEPHVSKGYNLMYEQIWKDIARRDVPKVYKIQQASLNIKQSNLRKTAQLAAKEARRWQQRTNKNVKDTQARAKRSMREMLTFWKRNEKEERDNRRKAEKEAIERAKREEEMREQKRQARKLNFLISQTELYSHFVGRKIKTNELERSTDTATEGQAETAAEKVPEAVKAGVTGVAGPKKFEELDFDNDDETHLHQAAMHNAQAALQETQQRARAFNAGAADTPKPDLDMEDGEMNFQNPTGLGDIDITQPKLLSCQLKEYQIKGLNWLANLYEQGINGILADEMGLGKTVQSISVMAYLAEKYDIWGPYLVVAPASTLHNWAQEISKFVPEFKVLPYWGNQRDRQILRKFWDRKSPTYRKDAQFHVLITSYQIVVGDAQYFQKMRWQYMILDEAQAIKSSQSSRWKTLLGMQCRNRLLLTGTPIQNSMQELWALLHFIMPGLFDSHDEFSEWFSKDIESHTQSNTQLNEQQLHRLHMILKPFMLRRVKKHVQKELGDKLEIDVYCDLTYRQRSIYKSLRDKLSVMDWLEKATSNTDESAQSLMNLVMQFRKVCNHPDLFERAEVRSPLSLAYFADTISFMREKTDANLFYTTRNHIEYRVPHKVYSEDGNLALVGPNSQAGMRRKVLKKMMNIWTPDFIDRNSRENGHTAFSWLRFVDTSPQEASRAANSDFIDRITSQVEKRDLSVYDAIYDDEPYVPQKVRLLITDLGSQKAIRTTTHEGIMESLTQVYKSAYKETGLANLPPAPPKATAPPIALVCDDRNALIMQDNEQFDPRIRKALLGPSPLEQQRMVDQEYDVCNYPLPPLLPEPSVGKSYSFITAPSMSRFVTDSGKLLALDKLLMELKAGGHRVLLYFQMTRMMDLAEEYLAYRKYKYLRLDGSSKVEDRRDMVSDFQAKPEIFIFLLSTRAGGLGLNLTAADCVIFYDSDWNPTVDQQAEDRAHRLGQTKQVRVYRLLTRGTIEERIRARACQKQDVQKVVMTGKTSTEKKPVDFSKGGNRDMALWLFDEETIEKQLAEKAKEKEQEKAAKKGARKGKKAAATATPKRSAEAMLESMYHEGEGMFDGADVDNTSTPGVKKKAPPSKGKKPANKKKSAKERLSMADGS